MWRRLLILLSFGLLLGLGGRAGAQALNDVSVAALPAEARATLSLIAQGGPYPFARDGVVFGNHEKRLPKQRRGYYHEYTVPTPGLKSRGTRRIIAGERGERYYTGDHYKSFVRIRE